MSKRTRHLTMGYRINKRPRGARPADAFRVMADVFLGKAKSLPAGWDITWRHSNNPLKPTKENPIAKAARESRSTFNVLALNRLRRDAARFNVAIPEPREIDEEDIEDFEEYEEEENERLSEETLAAARKPKPKPKKKAKGKK